MEDLNLPELLQAIFRWLHIFMGILWIGLLYFFNFVNGQFAATMDGETKKKVVPQLMPRVLFWFRWGAAWTWVTGVTLLILIFYHGKELLGQGVAWDAGAMVMVAVTFLAFLLYDALCKSPLGKDNKKLGAAGFLLIVAIAYLMNAVGHFTYRGYMIHIGAMFGTIMAFNVWFRIWPAQQKIITAIRDGQAPDAALAAVAGGRSRHNTYLSMPLLFAMIDTHTSYFSGGHLNISSECNWLVMPVVVLLGWHLIWICYKKAAKVPGF